AMAARPTSSDKDFILHGFAVGALQGKFRAFFMLVHQGFEQAKRVADYFGIRGRFDPVFQFLQPLHGLGRHFQLHPGGGALRILAGFGFPEAAAVMMTMSVHYSVSPCCSWRPCWR